MENVDAVDALIDALPDDGYAPCPCGCGKKFKFAVREGFESHEATFIKKWEDEHVSGR